MVRAVEEAMVKFKHSKDFVTFLKKEHEASYDTGYDVSIEEIFFNIWIKTSRRRPQVLWGRTCEAHG